MASKTQICNLALTQLGAQRIMSLDDGTENATMCNILFDDIADEVITLGPWSSCVFRATLGLLADAPEYEYQYQYQLPEDPYCLRVLEIYNYHMDPCLEFKIEGRKLLTNIPSVQIKYIGRPGSTSDYDTLLKRAITYRLKMELAYVIPGQLSVAGFAAQQYQQALLEGLREDGKQGSSEIRRSNTLIDIR